MNRRTLRPTVVRQSAMGQTQFTWVVQQRLEQLCCRATVLGSCSSALASCLLPHDSETIMVNLGSTWFQSCQHSSFGHMPHRWRRKSWSRFSMASRSASNAEALSVVRLREVRIKERMTVRNVASKHEVNVNNSSNHRQRLGDLRLYVAQ